MKMHYSSLELTWKRHQKSRRPVEAVRIIHANLTYRHRIILNKLYYKNKQPKEKINPCIINLFLQNVHMCVNGSGSDSSVISLSTVYRSRAEVCVINQLHDAFTQCWSSVTVLQFVNEPKTRSAYLINISWCALFRLGFVWLLMYHHHDIFLMHFFK